MCGVGRPWLWHRLRARELRLERGPPTWDRELRDVAPHVYAYVQAGGPGRNNVSVSDAGTIVGDDGLLIIDTLTAPMHAKDFIAAIRKVSDKPFRHVINTHHHGDHINGNQYFAGAEIVSHPYCREEGVKQVEGPKLWARREGQGGASPPCGGATIVHGTSPSQSHGQSPKTSRVAARDVERVNG